MRARWTALRPLCEGNAQRRLPAIRRANAAAEEAYGGKIIAAGARALAAWRGLVAAARRDVPAMAADRRRLTMLSGFRHPINDNIRRFTDDNCYGVKRAACSVHRTNLAIDAFVGARG